MWCVSNVCVMIRYRCFNGAAPCSFAVRSRSSHTVCTLHLVLYILPMRRTFSTIPGTQAFSLLLCVKGNIDSSMLLQYDSGFVPRVGSLSIF
jgi:hypothetical protein